MCQQDREPETSDREAKDAYDEFEERVRRIGIAIVGIWRELNTSERISHIAALATLIVLLFYTGYTIRIYKASNRTAIAAEKQLDLSQRPYLTLELQPIELRFTKDGAGFLQSKITIANIGHSIARNIISRSTLSVDPSADLSKVAASYCPVELHGAWREGDMLFPGQVLTHPDPSRPNPELAAVQPVAVNTALTTGPFKGRGKIVVNVVSCVNYRSPLDPAEHQTIRYFILQKVESGVLVNDIFFDPHGSYFPSEFRLISYGGDTAD
jgi:cbb3-type cytochrome oxidase subunit 3